MGAFRGRAIAFSVAASATVLGAIPGSQALSSARPIPDVTVLFKRAVNLVHRTQPPTFSHAAMLEADGVTRAGQGTTTAAGIVSWRFVLQNRSKRFASVTVTYGPAPKGFRRVTGHRPPFLEDVVIPRAPKMTLSGAVGRLRRAGHRKPFFNVTLRNPLGPKRLNPLYVFGFSGRKFIAVDTVTGRVAPIS